MPGFQKAKSLVQRLLPPGKPGMGTVQDKEIPHAIDPGAFHGHLSIVGAFKQTREKRIERPIAGNDTALKIKRPQVIKNGIGVRSKLEGAGAEKFSGERAGPEMVNEIAAVVWWRNHHHPSEILNGVVREILAENDAAERMSDKMDSHRRVGDGLPKLRIKIYAGQFF